MRALMAAALLAASGPALAVQPAEELADPALEARARDIGQGLRCVVCQNQSIDDSDAPLARDLRLVVRERLQAGDTDAQVVDYVAQRYGDFVRLKPPVEGATLPLWVGPALFIALGAAGLAWMLRRRRGAVAPSAPLSPAERAAADRLLDERA